MKKNILYATLALSGLVGTLVSSMAWGQIVGRATQQDWANAGGDAQRRLAGASCFHSSARQCRAMKAVKPMPDRQYRVAVSG